MSQGFPNGIKGWEGFPLLGKMEIFLVQIFFLVVGILGGVILTTQNFFRAKNNILYILKIN